MPFLIFVIFIIVTAGIVKLMEHLGRKDAEDYQFLQSMNEANDKGPEVNNPGYNAYRNMTGIRR